jgi:hypothetical protein
VMDAEIRLFQHYPSTPVICHPETNVTISTGRWKALAHWPAVL